MAAALLLCTLVNTLNAEKDEARYGHGVQPSPIVTKSMIHVFRFMTINKGKWLSSHTMVRRPSKWQLVVLLIMTGDIETNPGPGPQDSQTGRQTRQTTLTCSDGSIGLGDIMRELKDTRLQVNEKIDALGAKLDERYTELKEEMNTLKVEFGKAN